MLATPLFLLLLPIENFNLRIGMFFFIIFIEMTDLFDGIIARKYNAVSDIGKIIDPFADSIFRMTLFLALYKMDLISIWFFVLCVYRDSMVQTIRIVASNNGIVFSAKQSGKIKALFQAFGVLVIVLLTIINFKVPIANLKLIANSLMGIITAITLWSGIDYAQKLITMLKTGAKE